MTTLIARRSYSDHSDLGSVISAARAGAMRAIRPKLSNEQVAELGCNYEPSGDDPTAANACNANTQYWDGSTCVAFAPGASTPTQSSSGGVASTLASLLGGAASAYTSSQNAAAAQANAAAAAQNSWIVPVAIIGGVAIMAIAIMKKRPAQNPSRRRRRRARRRR